jgi:hypothetical protein
MFFEMTGNAKNKLCPLQDLMAPLASAHPLVGQSASAGEGRLMPGVVRKMTRVFFPCRVYSKDLLLPAGNKVHKRGGVGGRTRRKKRPSADASLYFGIFAFCTATECVSCKSKGP